MNLELFLDIHHDIFQKLEIIAAGTGQDTTVQSCKLSFSVSQIPLSFVITATTESKSEFDCKIYSAGCLVYMSLHGGAIYSIAKPISVESIVKPSQKFLSLKYPDLNVLIYAADNTLKGLAALQQAISQITSGMQSTRRNDEQFSKSNENRTANDVRNIWSSMIGNIEKHAGGIKFQDWHRIFWNCKCAESSQ